MKNLRLTSKTPPWAYVEPGAAHEVVVSGYHKFRHRETAIPISGARGYRVKCSRDNIEGRPRIEVKWPLQPRNIIINGRTPQL